MKKVCLVCVLLTLALWSVQAQNRQIRFEKSRVWNEILEKAKKEKKLVFVDFYTSWCAPCKQLVDSVFSRDEVADYFNKTFVCAHFDVEKDNDGKMLFKKHGMQAVPTLAFFTPETGKLIHLAVGAQDKNWLMGQAKLAQDPQNSLSGMAKRFEHGERDDTFLKKYLEMLNADQKRVVISDYLNDLPEEQFVTTKSWEIFVANIQNPLSKAFKRVMNERQKFYRLIGQEVVDNYLSTVIYYTVDDLTGTLLGGQEQGNTKLNLENVVNYLKSIDYVAVSGALASVKTAELRQEGDFDGMLNFMKEAIDSKLFMNGERPQFLIDNLSSLVLCSDTAIIEKGVEWIDKEFNLSDNCLYQANMLHVKSVLLEKMGKMDLAKQTKKLEDVYLSRAKKKSGGHIMRVFKTYQRNPKGNRVL